MKKNFALKKINSNDIHNKTFENQNFDVISPQKLVKNTQKKNDQIKLKSMDNDSLLLLKDNSKKNLSPVLQNNSNINSNGQEEGFKINLQAINIDIEDSISIHNTS